MKIDKKKLIELLVNKTEMEQTEVENQLDQLIDRILDAANQGKALEIKEFGLFYFDENGDLKFDPSDELSSEISFKYAGMKPVIIQPDRDSTIVAVNDKDEPFDQDETIDENSDDKLIAPDEFVDDESTPVKPLKIELDEEFIAAEEQSEEDDFDFLTELSDEPEPSQNRSKVKPAGIKPRLPRTPARKQNNAAIWVIAAIIIIGLIGIGIYMLFFGTSSPPQQQQAIVTPQAQPGTQELTDITDDIIQPQETTDAEEDTEPEDVTEPEPEAEVQQPQTVPQTIPADQPLYGLMGVTNQNLRNSYSIVLHSFTDEEIATNTANQLALEGYRTQVTDRTVANNTMWRVSVGQFQTLNEAQVIANTLPSPFNTQNFIHRIE